MQIENGDNRENFKLAYYVYLDEDARTAIVHVRDGDRYKLPSTPYQAY